MSTIKQRKRVGAACLAAPTETVGVRGGQPPVGSKVAGVRGGRYTCTMVPPQLEPLPAVQA